MRREEKERGWGRQLLLYLTRDLYKCLKTRRSLARFPCFIQGGWPANCSLIPISKFENVAPCSTFPIQSIRRGQEKGRKTSLHETSHNSPAYFPKVTVPPANEWYPSASSVLNQVRLVRGTQFNGT